jgi:type IV pilus biogenesis protein CpaD/CtpE
MSSPRFWLLALLLVATLASSCARRRRAKTETVSTPVETRTPEEVRRENVRDLASVMAEELKLNGDQTTRIRQVLATTVEQVNAAQAKAGTDKAALGSALKRINASSEAQLKQIMTPAQYQLYQQRKPQIQQKLREQRAAN